MRMGKRKTTAALEAISSHHTISTEMEPNNVTPTAISSLKASASSSYQKAVCLGEWWLVKSETGCDGKRLAVGGLTFKWQQAVRVFVSSPIVKRHDSFTLETADGITVIIQGLINRSRTHQNGFPPEACSKFLTGFPYNWEVYADQYFGKQSITQNASTSGSCFSELTKPSAEDGTSVSRICFDEIPMTRLLECLISTHGNFGGNLITRSLFTTMVVHISDDSGDATVQKDLHINISSSSLKGISKQDKAPTLPETINTLEMHDNGTGYVPGEFEANFAEGKVESRNATDTKNGGPQEHGKALSSKEKDNINHGSCDKPENEVICKSSLLGKSESPHPNASKDTLQVAADGTNATPSKKKSTVKESLSKVEPRRSSRRLKNLNNDSKGEEKAIGSIGVEIGKVSTISMPALHNVGPEKRILRRSSRRLKNLNNNSKGEKMAMGRIGVEIGKVSTISMPALHNFGPEARIEESFSMKGDDLHLECTKAPERGFFPGESVQVSDAEKNAKNFKKSKKIAIQYKEMDTSDATLSNSVPRRSSSRLKKSSSNLKEDRTMEYCLETERNEVGTLLENHDLESNGINPVEHILHEISALDPDEVSLREQIPAVSSDCLSPQGGVEPFDQNGYFGSSVEHYGTAGDSNIGVDGQRSNDKAKAKSRKKRKRVVVSQPVISRNRAKELSIVTPESFKRSRSGRVIVPALANWRNEQIIYDMDGGISGIALAYNEPLSTAGSKSKSLRKRKKH